MERPAARQQFAQFVEDLCEPGSTLLAPERFSRALQFRTEELEDRALVDRRTARDAPGQEALQTYMRVVVRVLSAAVEVSDGDIARAISWFRHHPIPELQHKTADELVSRGEVNAVLGYIDSISAGHAG